MQPRSYVPAPPLLRGRDILVYRYALGNMDSPVWGRARHSGDDTAAKVTGCVEFGEALRVGRVAERNGDHLARRCSGR